jgi:hypothetical protein
LPNKKVPVPEPEPGQASRKALVQELGQALVQGRKALGQVPGQVPELESRKAQVQVQVQVQEQVQGKKVLRSTHPPCKWKRRR